MMNDDWGVLNKKYNVLDVIEQREFVLIKAEEKNLGRTVAIKTLKQPLDHHAERVKRFDEEITLLASIKQENILSVLNRYPVDELDYRLYLVSDWMEQSLDEVLQEPLQPDVALAIFRKLLQGVGALHHKNIVLRNISPSDILLSHDAQELKIASLQSATAIADEQTLPDDSPEYIAPELFDIHARCSVAGDIYTLGMIAYHLFLGRDAYRDVFADICSAANEKEQRLRWRNWHADPKLQAPPLDTRLAGVSPTVSAVIARMMAKNPGDRFADIDAVLQQLAGDDGLNHQTWQVPEMPVDETAGVKSTQRSWLFWVGAAAALLLSALLVWVIMSPGRTEAQREELYALYKIMIQTREKAEEAGADESVKPFGEAQQIEKWIMDNMKAGEFQSLKDKLLTATDLYEQAYQLMIKPEEPAPPEPEIQLELPPAPIAPVKTIQFQMGSNEEEIDTAVALCEKNVRPDQSDHPGQCARKLYADELLQTVSLEPFRIDRTEVTNRQFAQFVNEKGYQTDAEKKAYAGQWVDPIGVTKIPGASWKTPRGSQSKHQDFPDHPVVYVSMNDAQAYCQWAGGRLPSEAEWEYSARGTERRVFPWGNQWQHSKLLWQGSTPLRQSQAIDAPREVGGFPAGATSQGLMDMAGSVWEWTSTLTANGQSILKGGSFLQSNPSDLRAAVKLIAAADSANSDYGFRCVETLEHWPQP